MRFGETKCAYQIIEKGKLVHQVEPILINGLTIEPIKNGEAYKYLGQDEHLGYVGPANKERVEKEFLKRVKTSGIANYQLIISSLRITPLQFLLLLQHSES